MCSSLRSLRHVTGGYINVSYNHSVGGTRGLAMEKQAGGESLGTEGKEAPGISHCSVGFGRLMGKGERGPRQKLHKKGLRCRIKSQNQDRKASTEGENRPKVQGQADT